MKRTSVIIKSLDFLSFRPSLFSDKYGNQVYKNTFGGIVSIVTCLVIFLAILYFSIEFIQGKNFKVNSNSRIDFLSEINLDELPFIFYLYNLYNPIKPEIQQKYWDMPLTLWRIEKDDDGVQTQTFDLIPLERCNLTKHIKNDEYRNLFFEKNEEYGKCLCPKFSNTTKLIGPYGKDTSIFLHLYIHSCYEPDESPAGKGGCVSKEEIASDLAYTYFHFETIDFTIENKNKNPLIPYIFEETIPLSSSINKRIWFTFQSILYSSDEGWLLEENKFFNSFQFNSYSIEYNFSNLSTHWLPNHFGSMTISFSQKKRIIERRYSKIQEMMANIGGILKSILFLSSIICTIISENLFYERAINNKNLSFKEFRNIIKNNGNINNSQDHSKSKIEIILSNVKINNLIDEKNRFEVNQSQSNSSIKIKFGNNNLPKQKSINNNEKDSKLMENTVQKRKISFSVLEYALPLFCYKTKNKNNYFLREKGMINENLSILNILDILTEIKNIESVLFDDFQISVLKNINYVKELKEEKKIEQRLKYKANLEEIQSRLLIDNNIQGNIDKKILSQLFD